MAFVVETGTGVATANSFASVAVYRAYHTERGKDVSAQTDEQVQQYLIRATDYVEKRFGSRYRGARATDTQALGFPREGVVVDGVELDDDALPLRFVYGVVEYAYRASLYAQLAPDTPVPFDREDAAGEVIAGGGVVIGKTEKVDVIEESTQYADPSRISAGWSLPRYPEADMLLRPYLAGGGGGRTLRA